MNTFTHKCIKCQAVYSDTDPEPYLCADCNVERLRIAAEVDAKLASRPKKIVKSDYGIALERGQTRGSGLFVRATDLGITFD